MTAPAAVETRPPGIAVPDTFVKVVFVQAHKHAGVAYTAGDSHWVSPETRDFLRQFGAIGEG
jgi:hypothetical protein